MDPEKKMNLIFPTKYVIPKSFSRLKLLGQVSKNMGRHFCPIALKSHLMSKKSPEERPWKLLQVTGATSYGAPICCYRSLKHLRQSGGLSHLCSAIFCRGGENQSTSSSMRKCKFFKQGFRQSLLYYYVPLKLHWSKGWLAPLSSL